MAETQKGFAWPVAGKFFDPHLRDQRKPIKARLNLSVYHLCVVVLASRTPRRLCPLATPARTSNIAIVDPIFFLLAWRCRSGDVAVVAKRRHQEMHLDELMLFL
jgi:hypothetical protein